MVNTAANGDERLQVRPLLQQAKAHKPKTMDGQPLILEADRGYDAQSLRLELFNHFIYSLIPYRRIKERRQVRLEQPSFRWRIERTFS